MKHLSALLVATGLALSSAARGQDEETIRDRAVMATVCEPALDLAISRFGNDDIYSIQTASPDLHEGVIGALTLAKMGMVNYKLFTSFAVAEETGRPSSEIYEEMKQAEVKARSEVGKLPAGKLPVEMQAVLTACVKSIYRHEKAVEESTKKSLLEYLDANLPLYFLEAK